jgi:creatinine amidohydrolase
VFGCLLIFCSSLVSAQILDVRELHPSQLAGLDRSRTVVLLTGGILEEHGPFLPSYSDGYQTEFVATRVAEAIVARPGWAVLRFPAMPLGSRQPDVPVESPNV